MGQRTGVVPGADACPIPPVSRRRKQGPWNVSTLIMSVSFSVMIVSNLFMVIIPPTLILPPAIFPPAPPSGNNMLLTKTDSSGNINWSYSYGGVSSDRGYTVIQTSDDGFAVVGSTNSFGVDANSIWLVRTDKNGHLIWNKTFGSLENQYGYDITELNDGGFAITGSVYDPGKATDVILIRVDFLGNKLWEQRFGGPMSDIGHSVVRCVDGGFAIGAITSSFGAGNSDMWLIRTDASGNLQWNMTYGGSNRDWANSLIGLRDGGFAFVGWMENSGQNDVSLIRLDSQGNPLWSGVYGDLDSQQGWTAVECKDGGFAIVGVEGAGWNANVWLGRTDLDGDMLWNHAHGGFDTDAGYSVIECDDGDYIVGGRKDERYAQSGSNLWLGRTDSQGAFEWSIAFDGVHSGSGFLLTGCSDGGFAFTGRVVTTSMLSSSPSELPDANVAVADNSGFESDVNPVVDLRQRLIAVFREFQT